MNVLEQAALASAANPEDLTKPEEGGTFERELPKKGIALLRLQSYIELGTQPQSNKAWTPRVGALFTFELLHEKHLITPEGKDPFPMTLTFTVSKSMSSTSRYIKLFNKMNYDGTHNHFDTLVGKPFLGELFERKTGTDKNAKTYINLHDESGEWKIGAPKVIDPITENVTNIPVPAMHSDGKLFLWNQPGWSPELIKAAWDTLYIEGENDNGQSKNWIQDRITSALDFEGSTTHEAITPQIDVLPKELVSPALPTTLPEEVTPAVTPPAEKTPDDATEAALKALGL